MDYIFTLLMGFYLALGLREFAIWVTRFLSVAELDCATLNQELTRPYPQVAILQTVCNDFNPDSFQSLIDIDYPEKAIILLDDSDSDSLRSFIATCSAEVQFPLFYRHRKTRSGHKAGNVNDALSSLPRCYQYVFLADSDQIVPPKILRSLVGFLTARPSVPFIQVHNKPNAQPGNEIPNIIIEGHHEHALLSAQYRALLQISPCVGHGALLNRWALTATGGLPEIVSEDIAWSLSLLSQGHRGAFYSRCFMGEAFPSTYQRFSKRFLRWCVADLECALTYLPRVICSQHITLLKKTDLVIGQLRFPSVPAGCILGLLLCLTDGIPIVGTSRLFLTVCLFMALLPVLVATPRIGPGTLALLCQAIPLYGSQLCAAVLEYVQFACRGHAAFYVTGDRAYVATPRRQSLTHVAIAVACVAAITLGPFHPVLASFVLFEGVWLSHQRFRWNHGCTRFLRGMTVAWVAIWVLMAYTVGGVQIFAAAGGYVYGRRAVVPGQHQSWQRHCGARGSLGE